MFGSTEILIITITVMLVVGPYLLRKAKSNQAKSSYTPPEATNAEYEEMDS